nr:hypothetical protein [Tanacetum cinerariifolium]
MPWCRGGLEGCASWDRGKGTWGGWERGFGTVQPGTDDRGCGYFMWMDDFRNRISSSRPSTPPTLYTRPSTPPSYSAGTFGSTMNVEKEECSNCKFFAEKIKTLEAKIKILEGTLEMERHPKNHTI